jgi:chondroitin-sulfate-ABC endolyase/exolyase
MNKPILLIILLLVASSFLSVEAQVVDYGKANGVFSFEDDIAELSCSKRSVLSISDSHSKLGSKSVEWKWTKRGSSFCINAPVPFLEHNPNPKETSVSSFVFWVYSPEALDGTLRFSFMKDGKECCYFDYVLGFKGWRGAWVAFDRDMEGTPLPDMDQVVVTASRNLRKGTLYFDGIITASFQDVRYHTADWQARFINKETTNFWLTLNQFWDNEIDIPLSKGTSDAEIADLKTIEDRFVELVTDNVKPWSIERIREFHESYGIRRNADGTFTGKPVWFIRYGETYINQGIPDAQKAFTNAGQTLRQLNDGMLNIAVSYMNETDAAVKSEIADIYISLVRHVLDQGFEAGSGLGTLHHLGYSMRNFYTGPVIMKEVLKAEGLDDDMQRAMEWFCGFGEVKTAPQQLGMDIDQFNTSLMGRFASVIMLQDGPLKQAYMLALSRWVDNGFKYTEGTNPAFKRDGTVVHHRKCYPEYAVGGFKGSVNAIWMLAKTAFAVSQESHEIQKEALLTMRFYSNLKNFPLAMSGRHPDGTRSLIPSQFALLADAGSPDGTQAIDTELAGAYLRLNAGAANKWADKFTAADISAEKAPAGGRNLAYNCSLSYRQEDWLMTIAGHSRYLWAAETYQRENHYGRYLAHGSMQFLNEGGSFESGYSLNGWDWCHIPGTTAAEIRMERMKANVLNVDEFSGYEEMLISDEWFAGGVTFGKEAAMYSMKLHEHDKYNGTLRANKSFFAFGNRVVCIGTDLENALPGSELHTTLFQNSISPECAAPSATLNAESIVMTDRFGNAYFVRDAEVRLTKGLQHSYHEETDAPTEGYFEKAYINHGTVCSDESYEYMVAVQATAQQLDSYAVALPYSVLKADSVAHIVKDSVSGITACSAFETTAVDELVVSLSPSVLMYRQTGNEVEMSVSNPDLALYSGESDEIFDADGKRRERSVYGRSWISNPAQPRTVEMVISGEWELAAPCEDVTVEVKDGKTCITAVSFECSTVNFKLIGI